VSHFIEAEDAEQRPLAQLEFSGDTVDSLACTGMDIYRVYDAEEQNAGVSGAGDFVTVDARTAGSALVSALAWASALHHCFPERFGTSRTAFTRNEDYDGVPSAELSRLTRALVDDFKARGLTSSDSDVATSVDRCEDIVAFAHAVFAASRDADAAIFFG